MEAAGGAVAVHIPICWAICGPGIEPATGHGGIAVIGGGAIELCSMPMAGLPPSIPIVGVGQPDEAHDDPCGVPCPGSGGTILCCIASAGKNGPVIGLAIGLAVSGVEGADGSDAYSPYPGRAGASPHE